MEWDQIRDDLPLELTTSIETPALVFSLPKLECLLQHGLVLRQETGIKLLFAVKALALPQVLGHMAPALDGFAVSSLFEARFIRDNFPSCPIHFTSPGIRPQDASELFDLCDYVCLNSKTQLCKYGLPVSGRSGLGIRVNTGVSRVADDRYDPCRPDSKLGIPLKEVGSLLSSGAYPIEGLHFHTNSESSDFNELLENVLALIDVIPPKQRLKWVNVGGGYLPEYAPLGPLVEASRILRNDFGVKLFAEPGAGLVKAAGFLVSTILDVFQTENTQIAVLDTTVNHMPEILEFDFQPDLLEHCDDGPFEYTLAGITCLAGDILGQYRFAAPLKIGERIVFLDAGAYTLVKAHRFNGTNLPQIGVVDENYSFKLLKEFTYGDFAAFWGTNG